MRNAQRNTRRWTVGTIALGVAALAVVMATAFSPSNASTSNASATSSEMDPAQQAQAVEADSRVDSVAVTISDGSIEMPTTVAADSITFDVMNNDQEAHGFAISGPVEARLDGELGAGQSETLTAVLEPGTYMAYCSVEGHQEQETAEFMVE